MGQYFKLVNLDKQEKVGRGGKFIEILENKSDMLMLTYLLRESVKDGGGDVVNVVDTEEFASGSFDKGNREVDWEAYSEKVEELTSLAGSWAGDDVRIVGDYHEDIDWNEWEGDIEDLTGYAGRWAGDDVRVIGDYNEDDLYDEAKDFEDITEDVRAELNRFLDVYGLEKIEEW